MEEKQQLTSNGAHETHADWATLATKAIDDVSHILHSEAELLQINLRTILRAQIDYALATLAMVAVLICATICALAALVLFLHQSFLGWQGFPWWQALAIGALVMFAAGIGIRAVVGRSTTLSSRDI